MKNCDLRVSPKTYTITAYLEIYGKDRMLAKVYGDFDFNIGQKFTKKLKDQVCEYLENKSGIDSRNIDHSVLSYYYNEVC